MLFADPDLQTLLPPASCDYCPPRPDLLAGAWGTMRCASLHPKIFPLLQIAVQSIFTPIITSIHTIMKKFLPFWLGMSLFITFTACPQEDPPLEPEPENIYEGCCGTEPVTAQVGQGSLFIPNIFTPNSDGINDVFMANADANIASISNFEVINRDDSIIFQLATLIPNAIAWDGQMGNGEGYNGYFEYRMTVSDQNGTSMLVSGNSCAFRCDTVSTVFEDLTRCHFPAQYDGNGGVDISTQNVDTQCFE